MQWGVPILPNAMCECVCKWFEFRQSFCIHCVSVRSTYLVFGMYVGPEGDQWLDAVCVAIANRQMQCILVENQEGKHVRQLRPEISHGRLKKLGVRFSVVGANLSWNFKLFACVSGQEKWRKRRYKRGKSMKNHESFDFRPNFCPRKIVFSSKFWVRSSRACRDLGVCEEEIQKFM